MDANALGTKDFTTHLSSITYGGGGFVQDLPLDNYEEALKIVQNLRKNKWIDSQITRILFIDFTTYNTQTKSYTAVKLYVEMKPLQMSSYHSITSVTVNEYDKFEDIIYLIYEGIFCSFTIFYFIQDLTELGRKGMSYFNDNWNLVDFVTLSVCSFEGFKTHSINFFNNRETKKNLFLLGIDPIFSTMLKKPHSVISELYSYRNPLFRGLEEKKSVYFNLLVFIYFFFKAISDYAVFAFS